ncbi:MAG: glycogen/starch synthase [Pseudohongiellaceae bacterium]
MHILLVAAENDALPGGKVGGLGDVIRDLPLVLARAGHSVSVITPGYGVFAAGDNATQIAKVTTSFCGRPETVALFRIKLKNTDPDTGRNIDQLVLEHPLFSADGSGKIYVTDNHGPFATDARRFALFCAAVARCIEEKHFGVIDVLHCHDWHTTLLLVLQRYARDLPALRAAFSVYSIHNLSLQGIRPFDSGVDSALHKWFPGLEYDRKQIGDPRYPDCVNLMRAGINLADRVHTVSPTYAREILQASNWEQGQVGGEGLEEDLQRVEQEGRLFGILNGCDYSIEAAEPLDQKKLWIMVEKNLDRFAAGRDAGSPSHYFALKNLSTFKRRRVAARPLLLSIGRLTTQKLFLLTREYRDHTVMDEFLKRLDQGIFIMLGSGDAWHDAFFTRMMQQHPNFLYLCGYSEELAQSLYASSDLFVMPSIYEPCGISQMLALRAGVPCLVHGVGGLNDTVHNQVNGFSFVGATLAEKTENLLATLSKALRIYRDKPASWYRLQKGARTSRFSWDDSVQLYLERLYRH